MLQLSVWEVLHLTLIQIDKMCWVFLCDGTAIITGQSWYAQLPWHSVIQRRGGGGGGLSVLELFITLYTECEWRTKSIIWFFNTWRLCCDHIYLVSGLDIWQQSGFLYMWVCEWMGSGHWESKHIFHNGETSARSTLERPVFSFMFLLAHHAASVSLGDNCSH